LYFSSSGGGGCDSRISEPTEDEPLLPETGQHPLPQLAAQDYKIGIDVGDNLLTGSPNEGNNKPVINWKRIKP